MGRSVSTPSGAAFVVYTHLDSDLIGDAHDWFDYVCGLQEYWGALWPSLYAASEWLGREDKAIMQNRHAWLGVSEYCGLVALWGVPKDDTCGLALHWLAQCGARMQREYGTLQRLGSMSNGVSVFRRVTA